MAVRTTSITVTSLVGAGLATIGFALSGVSALGDDLRVAARVAPATTPPPLLTPGEERGTPATTPPGTGARGNGAGETVDPAASEAQLRDVCDHRKGKRDATGRSHRPSSPGPTASTGSADGRDF